jgi:hypothetical protein
MELDVQRHVRDENSPELPSEAMQEEFELWENEYTVDNLTDLTVSQIESRKLHFDNQVQRLVMEHNPGKRIENNPVLAASVGKPAYTSQEWEQARKVIWRKKDEITLRFDQAKGKVKKEKSESKMEQFVRLVDSVVPDSVSLSLS